MRQVDGAGIWGCLLDEVKIGLKAIVGANAVVNRHLPKFTVIGATVRTIERRSLES